MPANQPPNILIIMSDEHAPMSYRLWHPLVQTPFMDRLVRPILDL